MGKTSIIILTHDTYELTRYCTDSIREYTAPGTYEIIVVDNGSTDKTALWLSSQKGIRYILNDENRGFPKGCNQGMEIAQGTEILLLNSDTVVTPNWLVQMKRALYSSNDIGAVSCVTNFCTNLQQIDVPYKEVKDMQKFAAEYNVSDPCKWKERTKLVGFCFLLKREVMEKIGLLDEQFTPGNFEDDDYSLRIQQAGYRLLLCEDTFIHHFGSATFLKRMEKCTREKEIEAYNALLMRNEEKFYKKWKKIPKNYDQLSFKELQQYL